MSARCPITNWWILVAVAGSLFLAISGSTILNMWYDRDVDAKMERTCWRPLPSGKIEPREALWLGLIISTAGVVWALMVDVLFGLVVFAGLFFDVVVYTIWLKRRTLWSIVWGGISGGMPILAGRALASGKIDLVGIVLALGCSRFLAGFLFGITPADPVTFASVTLGVLGLALATVYVPARRIAALDPATVLRPE